MKNTDYNKTMHRPGMALLFGPRYEVGVVKMSVRLARASKMAKETQPTTPYTVVSVEFEAFQDYGYFTTSHFSTETALLHFSTKPQLAGAIFDHNNK